LQALRQANEDLKKTLQINKWLITEVLSSGGQAQGLSEVIQQGIWEVERALEEARGAEKELRRELSLKDQLIQELRRKAAQVETAQE
jgi:hypothetical protein